MTYNEYKALLASNPNVRKMLDVISIMEGTSTFSNPYLAQGGTNGKLLRQGTIITLWRMGRASGRTISYQVELVRPPPMVNMRLFIQRGKDCRSSLAGN